MSQKTDNSLFTEISAEETTQINGGSNLLQLLAGVYGNTSSNWFYRNFYGNARSGNVGGSLRTVDRYVMGSLNSLRRLGAFF
ncbi:MULTISPECIES: hypothetical protein [Leptolyngbya]|uniref:hypothetical protein n=1 Tax=Leptolyngbya TaxID=47251 RepID=UPI0016822B2C|nr:hypothetical protein [Leptolyngbya sp. FACHB-1624]MBD1855494.1 hypothetical protein [Leptolyngbya sp. FACHB-1624]